MKPSDRLDVVSDYLSEEAEKLRSHATQHDLWPLKIGEPIAVWCQGNLPYFWLGTCIDFSVTEILFKPPIYTCTQFAPRLGEIFDFSRPLSSTSYYIVQSPITIRRDVIISIARVSSLPEWIRDDT